MRRALVLLAVLALVVPSVAAPVVGASPTALAEKDSRSEPHDALSAVQENATENTTTTTPETAAANESESGSSAPAERPESADMARLLPVQLDSDVTSVETVKQGEKYNTSGPFVFLQVSEPVEQAAITESKATATVLEGGRIVRVQYDSDAAPVGSQSLYRLQLYFEDDSSKTVELMAERTSVEVGSASMKKYRPFIMKVLNDAEDNGFDRNPEGAEGHYEDQKADAQLLNSLFSEYAKRLFGSLLSIVMNPLGIAAGLILASLLALWLLRKNEQALEITSNDSGKSSRLRERLWIEYQKQQQTAADEPLREVVGEMNAIYWSDAFGVDSVAGLAELFRRGIPVERDGEIQHIGGVEDVRAEEISASWLEAVCREHRIPSPELALSDGKKVLHRMMTKYGMAHHYQDSYETVRELIDDLDESRDVRRHSAGGSSFSTSSSSSSGAGGTSAGGDD